MFKAFAAVVFAASAALASADQAPTVHAAMTQVFAPGAQAIWDVTNRAIDDDGRPAPAQISADDWTRLGQAGRRIRDGAEQLARAARPRIAEPGVKLQDEGAGAGAAKVQAYVDADPGLFATHLGKLAGAAEVISQAAAAKDAKRLFEAADDLDGACQGCHAKFWYPQN